MSRLNQQANEVLPDYVYFDVLQTNFKSTTTEPPIFTINETRSSPFIQLPEKYDLSILRFQIDTGSVPLFIPSIEPDQADINKTIYSVTLVDTDYPDQPQQVFLNWVAQDQSAPIPAPPSNRTSKTQDNTKGYYNCYSYNWLCDLVYQALQGALNNLATAIGASNMIVTGDVDNNGDNAVYPPLIYWDANSKSAVIQGQLGAYSETLSRKIEIFFNAPLFDLFNSFQSVYLGYEGVTFGRNNRIILADIGGINIQSVIPNYTNNITDDSEYIYKAITIQQEYSTQEQISPIASLVFASNTLPIQTNQTSNTIVFIDGIPVIKGTNASSENIITDMVSSSGQYRSGITYSPTAEFRRVHLYGNRPLSNLDINIYYRLKNGELIPFRMISGGKVSMKIGFLKKV
jgi:hypothetical protein